MGNIEGAFLEDTVRGKALLRDRMKEDRKKWLNAPQRSDWDDKIVEKLLALTSRPHGFASAFVALSDEPKIWPSLHQKSQWVWGLPKMKGSRLEFFKATEEMSLQTGQFGIREPFEDSGALMPVDSLELFCVPGLAFDEQGRRLGRGKGFYDQTLKDVRGLKVGVCYSSQFLNENIPTEDHDVRMDYVVTENLIHKVKA